MDATTRLLIGNDFDPSLREDRGWSDWWVQRIIWFAQNGDVVLLPSAPDESFLSYATRLSGVDRGSLSIVHPETGSWETDRTGWIDSPEVVAATLAAIGDRRILEIFPLWPDSSVARAARSLKATPSLAGMGFVEQDGGRLLNSKSVFRAIADGCGAPVPRGGVCSNRATAKKVISTLLDGGKPAILKQDYLSGGRGNEVLSPGQEFQPIGARRVVPIRTGNDLEKYLEQNWSNLTYQNRDRLVVEEYFLDSRAYFCEYFITESGVELGGTGELLSAPYAVGQIMPAHDLSEAVMNQLLGGGERVCQAVRAIGYRGVLSCDGIVTPQGHVYFTEYNGRVSGSTHIYERIGKAVVGRQFGSDRVILERVWPTGWSVESFADAESRLELEGLAFDPTTNEGVVLTNAFNAAYSGVMYCIVAPEVRSARAIENRLRRVFQSDSLAER